jgi:hypothetical protein
VVQGSLLWRSWLEAVNERLVEGAPPTPKSGGASPFPRGSRLVRGGPDRLLHRFRCIERDRRIGLAARAGDAPRTRFMAALQSLASTRAAWAS